MMTKYILIFFVSLNLINPYDCISQEDNRVLDRSSDQEEVLDAFGERLIGKNGTYYLDQEWRDADIYFRSGLVVKGFKVRFDIEFNLLEVQIGKYVKVLPIGKLMKYEFLDPGSGRIVVHGSGRDIRTEHGTPLSGLCEIYERGGWAVISKYLYSIKDPDYIKALDVGNKDRKLFVVEEEYLCIQKVAYPLSTKKKELMNIIGEASEEARLYMENEKLNPRRFDDLQVLVDYMAEK